MNRSCQRQTAVLLTPLPHNGSRAAASGGQQDDPSPPDMFLRTVPIRHNSLQQSTILGGDFNLDTIAHPADSQLKGSMGILNRTQMCDFVH
jgi:hypothetical protein